MILRNCPQKMMLEKTKLEDVMKDGSRTLRREIQAKILKTERINLW